MWQISPIAVDWVEKGFHLRIDGIELVLRPDHRGKVVFKPFFSTTPPQQAAAAITKASNLLADPKFRKKAHQVAERAVSFLTQSISGDMRPAALGRAAERNFLKVALEKLEP